MYFQFFFLLFLISCGKDTIKRQWKEIQKSDTIKILSVNSSSTYFQGKDDEEEGFEYDLALKFAKDHNLTPKIIIKESVSDVLLALDAEEGDIGSAGISITDKRIYNFSFSNSYFKSRQVVTCRNKRKIKDPKLLTSLDIIVPEGTSFVENLIELQKSFKELKWTEVEGSTSEELLQEIWKDKSKCTITDEHILNLHRRYMPELRNVYRFKRKDKISWATKRGNKELLKKIDLWFQKKATKKYITDLKRKYFDFNEFNPYNLKVFLKRIKERLPKYEAMFKEASEKTGIPWELLAAVGYQESYWNPTAKSPTGVRGLMMLTRKTAKEVGVKNRLDPKESIMGGAKYLKKTIDRIPSYVHSDDKIWYALASYNVGYYHLRDAMALTIWRNKNPNRWHDVQKVLPLLSYKKYYRRLVFGQARGMEPVIYVKRIKDFFDILKKQASSSNP